MSKTLSIRLPEESMDRLRKGARDIGVPVGRLVRESLESSRAAEKENSLLKFAGLIEGPPDLSSRKGFSRK